MGKSYAVRNCRGQFCKNDLRKGSIYKVDGVVARFRGTVGENRGLGVFTHHSFAATKPVSLAKKASDEEVDAYLSSEE